MPERAEMGAYRQTFLRLLIDTQIPDWDPGFMSEFSPETAVAAARTVGAEAVMAYFQSHVGLCNWRTTSGVTHRAFEGRDMMAEVLEAARDHELRVCAYYSVNFNNWAWEAHPEWRLVSAVPTMIGGGILQRERYGLCCLNHPDYRQFVRTQTRELLAAYDVDAMFFDMIWWMSVCVCAQCRRRYRAEAGRDLPETIDWLDPGWCRFQAAREQWLTELAVELQTLAKQARPGIDVYHNFALGMTNWTRGVSFDSAKGHDFLGGDFYGGRDEQLVVSRLMLNLSESRPVEFMTTVAANLAEHERLKPAEALETQVFAAAACSSAFLAIACFDPRGTLNPAMVERIGKAFREAAPYTAHLGGQPVEDIAIYFSSDSKVNFADNGRPLTEAPANTPFVYPHLNAVRGACRALQRLHLPFGVITRKQLAELDRYRVLILPNVLRMDLEEVAAIRQYVQGGGRLYASRHTSLTETCGVRHADFMLADLFGCHYQGAEPGITFYLKPATTAIAEAIAPERYISHWNEPNEMAGALRLEPDHDGHALLTLSLPYGYPSRGTVEGRDWSSIHSFPPWEDTDRPIIVTHDHGRGRTIYSAADVETGTSVAHERLFANLICELIGSEPAFESNGHPVLWMSAFDQPERSRWIVSFLNYGTDMPPLPIGGFQFRLRPPAGQRFRELIGLPDEAPVACSIDASGGLRGSVNGLQRFAMYAALYQPVK